MTDLHIARDRDRTLKMGMILMLPMVLFLIVFLLALILKNTWQNTYSFLWSAKHFQAYCELKNCPLQDQYVIKNNILIHEKNPSMYQENLYFYNILTHQNHEIDFVSAEKLVFLNSEQAPLGFSLISTFPFNSGPFPFNFWPELAYGSQSSTGQIARVALEKNGYQLRVADLKNLNFDSQNLNLLGWVQS